MEWSFWAARSKAIPRSFGRNLYQCFFKKQIKEKVCSVRSSSQEVVLLGLFCCPVPGKAYSLHSWVLSVEMSWMLSFKLKTPQWVLKIPSMHQLPFPGSALLVAHHVRCEGIQESFWGRNVLLGCCPSCPSQGTGQLLSLLDSFMEPPPPAGNAKCHHACFSSPKFCPNIQHK